MFGIDVIKKRRSAKAMSGRNAHLISLFFLVMLLPACTQTFLISKDCRNYFFGSDEKELRTMLCDSGDLRRILDDAQLPPETKDSLYGYQCTERSGDKVRELYGALSLEQKRDLKYSFQKHGYDINYRPTRSRMRDPFGYEDYTDLCPPGGGY